MSYDNKNVKSQIGQINSRSQIPWSKRQMIFDYGMQYTIGKIFLSGIKYCPHMLQTCFFQKDMNVKSFKTTRAPILGLPFGSHKKKCHLDVTFTDSHRL
jgi:hypothetical protein